MRRTSKSRLPGSVTEHVARNKYGVGRRKLARLQTAKLYYLHNVIRVTHPLLLSEADKLCRRFLLLAGVNLPRTIHEIHELRRMAVKRQSRTRFRANMSSEADLSGV